MFERLGGCLNRLLALSLLVSLTAVVWVYRAELGRAWRDLTGRSSDVEVSQALADAAQARLDDARAGRGPDRVSLTQSELQSLLRYRWADSLPDWVAGPTVELEDGRIRVGASVPTRIFDALRELDEIAPFMPDTADMAASGQFVPLSAGYVALEVHELTAARIPLPKRVIPALLDGFGRRGAPGLAPDALAVPLPPGMTTVFVSGDSLVFVRSTG